METPSEWAKRFNHPKTSEEAGLTDPEAAPVASAASSAEFPHEPFSCPACGQLLGPACRVCVACKQPINPAEIAHPREVAHPAAHAPGTEPRLSPVPYPWRIFFLVLAMAFFLGIIYSTAITYGLLREDLAQLTLHGAPLLVGVWVFFDALRRRIPRPLRWAVGTMLLLIVVFPWYLARRKTPHAPVPFVEAEVGPVTRFLLYVLLAFFLASLIFYIVQGPPHVTPPAPQPQIQKPDGNSPARITDLRFNQCHSRPGGGKV